MKFDRLSGILLHPTALPGREGIGTLGMYASEFVDFLAESGQSLWQMCPLGPTGYGNSPYQCFSAFAGNPLLIDLPLLVEDGLLVDDDLVPLESLSESRVDYPAVITNKLPLLVRAAVAFIERGANPAFEEFCVKQSAWLDDYARFAAIKVHFGGVSWSEWEDDLRHRKPETLAHYDRLLSDEIACQKVLQFFFFEQWSKLKRYANEHGVEIVGDIPIFVAFDSADAWANPELFEFDADMKPIRVAGVPPDYFSKTGQRWGNPLYDWEYARKTGFAWWIERVRSSLELSDIIRIDHFRGFVSCWAVPAEHETAEHGSWVPAAGVELFEAIKENLGDLPIIAEDLGVITPEVEALRDSNGFPGMKVLQFAFDSAEDNDFLPHNYIFNSVVYTGTHDNDTACGWFENAKPADRQFALDYLDCSEDDFVSKLIRAAWASPSAFALAPLQDLLELGNEARTNLPGTSGGNWEWRFVAGMLHPELAVRLLRLTEVYRRKRPAKTDQ